MPKIETSAGPIHYGDSEGDSKGDSGGGGRPLVLLHGLAMDGRLWDDVVAELSGEFRCITPTLPLGSHPEPMNADADLSLLGMARIVAELIDKLDAGPVTLCFNDWSGAQVMIAGGITDGVERLILVSCETEGNYPPGLAGQAAVLSMKMPGGISIMRHTLLSPTLRRLPMTYGQMSKRGVSDELMRGWLEPLARPEIQRDLRKYVGDVPSGKRVMAEGTARLGEFDRPVLVVWDREGKMMPNDHGRALADSFEDSELVELDDCYTLIPIDQPVALAGEIRKFAATG